MLIKHGVDYWLNVVFTIAIGSNNGGAADSMSLDYPNRNDWLAVRSAQNAPRRVRYAHKTLLTFSAGRNTEKRHARNTERVMRQRAVALHKRRWRDGHASKGHCDPMVNMLAHRRLRQRQQSAS